jgi:hypothetical protein
MYRKKDRKQGTSPRRAFRDQHAFQPRGRSEDDRFRQRFRLDVRRRQHHPFTYIGYLHVQALIIVLHSGEKSGTAVISFAHVLVKIDTCNASISFFVQAGNRQYVIERDEVPACFIHH